MHRENTAMGLGPKWEMFFRAADQLAWSVCAQLCSREEEQFYWKVLPNSLLLGCSSESQNKAR